MRNLRDSLYTFTFVETVNLIEATPQSNNPSANRRKIVISLTLISLLITGFATFGLRGQANRAAQWRAEAIDSKIVLTQAQLEMLVKDEKLVAYWAGPKVGALYTLNASRPDQTIIRYIDVKNSKTTVLGSSRQIATYKSDNAYTNAIIAASSAGNVGFRNPDGAIVFYAANRLSNVYLAIPKINYQIEIYDPIRGQALSLAALTGQITRIGVPS